MCKLFYGSSLILARSLRGVETMFQEDGLFSRIFGFLGQLVAINLLWIVCTIPVITAGASTTALFYCTLKIHKDGECRPIHDFWKSFKQNFKQATVIWLFLIVAAFVIYFEAKAVPTMPGIMPTLFSYLLLAVSMTFAMAALYIFPTLAAFENKITKLVLNAFYFSVKNLLYVLAVALITVMPMFFTLVDAKLFPVYLLVWLLCGFSLTALADSWFFWKLFRPYFTEAGAEEKYKGTESDRYVF